ncbi:hypothetical protein BKA70DRAFT_1429100 [Coprinopsis sp. MPI-PUGE-AT-0042]|nr:hypothetical protein BKA70DRAFT_1429100 [Coprinopsis sp. MPI-PUGE-AT-0042]
MKFTASFAVLAVFVSQAVVSAAPTPMQYDSALEARADFTDGALEEVWARFYDELLEEVDAREYDEEVFERAPMKKFAQDLAVGLAQKAPGYAKQHSQSQESKARNSAPRMANVAHQASQQSKPSSSLPKIPASSKWNTVKKPSVMAEIKKLGKPSIASQAKGGFKRSVDEIFERGFGKDLGIGLGQKAPSYAKQYTQSKNAQIRNSLPRAPFVTAHQQSHSKPSSSKSSSGKKRSLDDIEEAFERGFGKDLGIGLGQKAPSYAKQYTQSKNAQIRNSLPRAPFVTAHQQSHSKPSSSKSGSGKKRSLDDIEEAIFERGFGKDLGIGLGQKTPSYAKQYTQSKNTQIRNSQPRAPFVTAHQQSHLKPSSSKSSSGKKRSLDDIEEAIFERGFGQDLAIGLAQKAPSYAKQYTQSQNAKIRNSLPRAPFVTAHQQSHSKKSSSGGKKRSLDIEEEIFEDVL